ncbi:protein of unknown function [Shewanella benthica]|uniref:Uncharacterized protein n=1 Tax=Shewanella benthica TaxID=43661 RepID=A0A330LXH3_9GAMM|nr:protein of unknown function [Shewanella benthica]
MFDVLFLSAKSMFLTNFINRVNLMTYLLALTITRENTLEFY